MRFLAEIKYIADALSLAFRPWQYNFQALAVAAGNTSKVSQHSVFPTSLNDLFDGIFYAAVPKSRRSREKRAIRRYGCHDVKRHMTPRSDINVCLNCGHYHIVHTLCGNCHSKVKEETEEFYRNNPNVTSQWAK